MQPPENGDSAGIRFGADSSNAYAGEVGYDAGPAEYNTELVDNEEEIDDEGRMHASHPSTLHRRMVRFANLDISAPRLNPNSTSFKRQDLMRCCFVAFFVVIDFICVCDRRVSNLSLTRELKIILLVAGGEKRDR